MFTVLNIITGAVLLASTITARPTASSAQDDSSSSFNIISIRSGSDIQYGSVNACDGSFFIAQNPCPICPIVGATCPVSNSTSLDVQNGYMNLNVIVPGGQRAYVTKEGVLSYTQAHSAYIPDGAIQTGFSLEDPLENTLRRLDAPAGFLACPTTTAGKYQVFLSVPGLSNSTVPTGNTNDCLGFDALTATYGPGASAWQY